MTQSANLAALGSNASSTGTLGASSYASATIPNSALSGNPTFRNRIINGNMMIDQRNAGASVTPVNDGYMLDSWKFNCSQASKFTAQQSSTAPAGFSNSMLFTVTSAVTVGSTDNFMFSQRVEGFNFADLGWGTADAKAVTLSFWVRSSLTGTFGGSFQNNAENRSYPFTYTISAANTWEQKTVTVAGDTSGTWVGATNGVGLKLWFGLGLGSTYSGTAGAWAGSTYFSATGATSVVGTNGATFYITGVQLERGSTASSFEYRNYGVELMMCQRYYYKVSTAQNFLSVGTTYSTYNVYGPANLPVKMRTTPSFSYSDVGHFAIAYGVSGYACTVLGLNAGASDFPSVYATQAGTSFTSGSCGMIYISNASGWWSWSAEL